MKKITLGAALTLAVTFAGVTSAAWHVSAMAQAGAFTTQSSVDRGVTVKVTPKMVAGAVWEFAVVLDTHAEDLKDDLQETALLVVDGREIRPLMWQGPGAGGHHREGVLCFPAADGSPGSIELRIQRSGEAAPRVFLWDGAALK
jgi:hypothetical protein